ncbi:MAG: tetratricopeptide repeat protein [Acidobacteriota bacterium]
MKKRITTLLHWAPLLVLLVGLVCSALGQTRSQSPTRTASETAELQEAQRLSEQVVKLFAEYKYDEALPLATRSLAIRERILGPSDPNVAAILNSVAEIYRRRDDYRRAEPLHLRALSIFEKSLGPNHQFVARSLNNLGLLYSGRGDYRKAQPLFERAAAIYEKALGPNHLYVALVLNNLGNLYTATGSLYKAELLYKRALTIREAGLGKDDPLVATTLINLAVLYAASGDSVHAVESLARGLDLEERQLSSILATGSEDQKLAYTAKLSSGTSNAVSLHLREAPNNVQAARLALTTVLRRKGRVLDALAESLQTLRRLGRPEDQALLEKLAAARARLSGKVLKPGEKPESPPATPATVWGAFGEMPHEINKIKEEVRQLEAELSARSVAATKPVPPITLEMIQSLIPQGTALVELALYDTYNFKPTKPQEKWGTTRYGALRAPPRRTAQMGRSGRVGPHRQRR